MLLVSFQNSPKTEFSMKNASGFTAKLTRNRELEKINQ